MTIGALLFIVGCDSKKSEASDIKYSSEAMLNELKVGGVYVSKNEKGKFTVTKILVLDEFAVHARFYNEEFDEIPSEISTNDLTFLIGHAPVAREGFLKEDPKLIATEKVSDDELEGYKLYLEAMRE